MHQQPDPDYRVHRHQSCGSSCLASPSYPLIHSSIFPIERPTSAPSHPTCHRWVVKDQAVRSAFLYLILQGQVKIPKFTLINGKQMLFSPFPYLSFYDIIFPNLHESININYIKVDFILKKSTKFFRLAILIICNYCLQTYIQRNTMRF